MEKDFIEALVEDAKLAASCCRFHHEGGTRELWCGDDAPNAAGRHSTTCAYHAGGDCTCSDRLPEYNSVGEWEAR